MSQIKISPAKIQTNQEKKILTNAIVDDDFAKAVIPIANPDYFDVAYCKTVFFWLKEYFQQYGCAPKKLISDIYNVKKEKLSVEDAELISEFLEEIAQQHLKDDEKRNTQYQVDNAIKYIEKQSYIRLSEKLVSNAKLDYIDECKSLIQNHKVVASIASGCVNPSDPEFVEKTIIAKKADVLFQIPGPLGKLIIPERGRLIGLMAPPKVGKTWMLHELGVLARMERLKVFECNCEMSATKVNFRDLKRITGCGDDGEEHIYSVVDCRKNQFGICTKPERKNSVVLINDDGEMPLFGQHNKKYQVCTACRRKNDDFELSFWFEKQFKSGLTLDRAFSAVNSFNMMYGKNNYRLKAYPKFSATVDDVIADLDMLEYTEGFVPDVLIVDYADILKSTNKSSETRHQLDEIWKMLGKIATERNILVLTASQTNRVGASKKNVGGGDIAEDFRKIAHIDSLIMMQQTVEEKKHGLLRLSVGYNRDGDADSTRQVMVFQNLATGQPFLDSEWVNSF